MWIEKPNIAVDVDKIRFFFFQISEMRTDNMVVVYPLRLSYIKQIIHAIVNSYSLNAQHWKVKTTRRNQVNFADYIFYFLLATMVNTVWILGEVVWSEYVRGKEWKEKSKNIFVTKKNVEYNLFCETKWGKKKKVDRKKDLRNNWAVFFAYSNISDSGFITTYRDIAISRYHAYRSKTISNEIEKNPQK